MSGESFYLELLHGGFDLGITHVLFAHQVVIHTRLCVTDNEKGPTHLAHLHLFLLSSKALNSLHKKHMSNTQLTLYYIIILKKNKKGDIWATIHVCGQTNMSSS